MANSLVRMMVLGFVVALGAFGVACGSDNTPKTTAGAPHDAEIATTFDEFPILWLGESYDSDGDGIGDMPLRSAYATHDRPIVNPVTGEEDLPARSSFSFGYGDCEIPPGDTSCSGTLTIIFYPAGTRPPISPGVSDGQKLRLRGVDAEIYRFGNLRFDTADFTVTISPSFAATGDRLNQSVRIASMLEGANPKASNITRDSDFRPFLGTLPSLPTPPPGAESVDQTPVPVVTLTPPATSETALVP